MDPVPEDAFTQRLMALAAQNEAAAAAEALSAAARPSAESHEERAAAGPSLADGKGLEDLVRDLLDSLNREGPPDPWAASASVGPSDSASRSESTTAASKSGLVGCGSTEKPLPGSKVEPVGALAGATASATSADGQSAQQETATAKKNGQADHELADNQS
mmetsp:Transcript_98346/g.194928  ORF Transcript_98346/g.194928 Transcript_98346/m.194928 type:complete len:161 (-) Transcript_98346:32-514(-)